MNGAIILAAGRSTRFGEDSKQHFKLNGIPLYEIVFQKVCHVVNRDNVVIVGIDCAGGETRSLSVFEGLKRLAPETQRVVILEAARPLVSIEQIETILNADSPSTSFVMPTVNTVVFRDGRMIDRNSIYDLLVPQAFSYPLLLQAYQTGRYTDTTEETQIMLKEYQIPPLFIETGTNLFKLTYKTDVAILKEIATMNQGVTE